MAATALAAGLVASGCGGDGGDGATPRPTATTPSPAPTAPSSTAPAGATTSPAPAPPTAASLAEVRVRLTEVAVAEQPVHVVVRPGTGELLVVERAGTVRSLAGGALAGMPFLDISGDTRAEGERGLLGATFSPDGTRFYASYTNRDGDSRLDEWQVAGEALDPATRRTVLAQEQPFANHNGGHVTFGPDGLLWYGLGDGGSAGDPGGRAQDPTTLLGKVLRIDPARAGDDPYALPADNPFAGGGGRGEIAILGVRNPWRFSFDRGTGALWVADVGQHAVEEVTALPAGGTLGANLGWNHLEGSRPYRDEPPPPEAIGPTYEYTHAEGSSITGGVVYRGAAIPGLRGAYLFGDLATAEVWALPTDGTSVGERVALGVAVDPGTLVSFAEDAEGEVYVVSLGGPVLRLDPA